MKKEISYMDPILRSAARRARNDLRNNASNAIFAFACISGRAEGEVMDSLGPTMRIASVKSADEAGATAPKSEC